MPIKRFKRLIWWKVALLSLILLPLRIALSIADGKRGVDILAPSVAIIVILVLASVLAVREYRKNRHGE